MQYSSAITVPVQKAMVTGLLVQPALIVDKTTFILFNFSWNQRAFVHATVFDPH